LPQKIEFGKKVFDQGIDEKKKSCLEQFGNTCFFMNALVKNFFFQTQSFVAIILLR
jgi:hypothetical protein